MVVRRWLMLHVMVLIEMRVMWSGQRLTVLLLTAKGNGWYHFKVGKTRRRMGG